MLSTYNGVSTDKFIFSIILEYFSRENGSNVPYVPIHSTLIMTKRKIRCYQNIRYTIFHSPVLDTRLVRLI